MKVLLTEPIHEKGFEILKKEHEIFMASGVDEETLCREVMGMDALIVRSIQVPLKLFKVADKLKVIGRHGMGLDNIDLTAASENGIMVVNTPTANVCSVAEHIVSVILALSKNIVGLTAAVKNGRFSEQGRTLPGLAQQLNLLPSDVGGKRLGLIGLGKIGSRVANICGPKGLGMELVGYDPAGAEIEDMTMMSSMEEFLADIDFLSLQVPLTDATRSMIGYKELSMMKKNAYLINASRGHVVNEEGLIKALKEDRIAGAALDVYWQEPLPEDHELFHMDNVILTPHVAGVTKQALQRISIDTCQGIVDALAGRRPKYLCNPDYANAKTDK
jgi:D-3-phosphoglycerate dehydrogenase